MITTSILFIFLGGFLLYNASKKEFTNHTLAFEKWIQNNKSIAKRIGVLLLIIALVSMTLFLGRTSGILVWLFVVALILSLLILVYPLKKINYTHILTLFIVLIIIEITNNL